jgi:TonB family protein
MVLRMIKIILSIILTLLISACATRPPVSAPPISFNPEKYDWPAEGNFVKKPLKVGTPLYPRDAYRLGYEGWVVLRFDISKSGEPQNIKVIDGSPKGYFEKAASIAMSKSKYDPVVINGNVTRVNGMLRYMTWEIER